MIEYYDMTLLVSERQERRNIARVLNYIETNKVAKEGYLMRQDNIIYKFMINTSFLNHSYRNNIF